MADFEAGQLVPESRSTQGVVSFLSSTEREGRWQLPRRFRALAVMGNVEIGTFVLKYEGRANPAAASRDKVLRVTGTAYAGAVTVSVKGPDEKMLAKLSRNLGFGSD